MDEKEIEHRLTELEQRSKSNQHRIEEHDEEIKALRDLISTIKELATEVKYMRGDLNETITRLNKLENRDVGKWDKFKRILLTSIVTIVLGYIAVAVGHK